MRTSRLVFLPLIIIASLLACSVPGQQPAPTATLFVLPTPDMTRSAQESTPFGTQPTDLVPAPTEAATTEAPTVVVVTPTGIVAATEPPAGGTVDRVQIFLIALEDNGKSGDAVGCGDSVVPVERQIAPTQTPLRAALEELLNLKDQFLGESGLYNSLYQSELTIDRVAIENGKATVEMSGQPLLGGTCDAPRFEAQIMKTILQFPTITAADVFINGTPLKDVISSR